MKQLCMVVDMKHWVPSRKLVAKCYILWPLTWFKTKKARNLLKVAGTDWKSSLRHHAFPLQKIVDWRFSWWLVNFYIPHPVQPADASPWAAIWSSDNTLVCDLSAINSRRPGKVVAPKARDKKSIDYYEKYLLSFRHALQPMNKLQWT